MEQQQQSYAHSNEQLWGAVEIIPNRLYYAPLKFFPPEYNVDNDVNANSTTPPPSNKTIHYFSIDTTLIYWNFFLDFGPLNLGQLYRFSSLLNHKLSSPEYKDDIICYYSSGKGDARANASFLICAWSMLYLGRGLEESYFGFREEFGDPSVAGGGGSSSGVVNPPSGNVSLPPQLRLNRAPSPCASSTSSIGSTSGVAVSNEENKNNNSGSGRGTLSPFARLHPLPPFHDASPIVCTYDLSVYDCLRGLDKARKFGFFKFGNTPTNVNQGTSTASSRNPDTFNVEEYEYFEQVENGDLNWIMQNKILAFAGPQNQKLITPEGFCMLTPADYIPYFLKKNVKLVVRLNKKCYEEREFENAGINHVEHYYLDGSCPDMKILRAVLADMESIAPDEAMAIHCKAGLGRTGTCIGAYMMKHYRMTAREVIGWMRICRPGMVIGPQQHFLEDIEQLMWQEGEVARSNAAGGGGGASGITIDSDEQKPASIMATPQHKGTHAKDHVTIVTPETGPSSPLPASPASKSLNMSPDDSTLADSPSSAFSQTMHSTPSSTSSLPTMDELKVQEQGCVNVSSDIKEGDQANALLSRRLEQNQVRRNLNDHIER
jgi:cell division cycle 14